MSVTSKSNHEKQTNQETMKLVDETIKPVVVKKSKRKPRNHPVNTKNVIPTVLDWLEDNASKFGFRPYVRSITEDNVEVSFRGIPFYILSAKLDKLEEYVDFSIEVKRNGVFHEYLFEFGITPMCNRKGYYDEDSSPREYFKDEESLVKNYLKTS